MSVYANYLKLDDRLTAKGFPVTSPWWRETLKRFYASGRRQLVLRVGRRGGKSSSLCRVAVAEALWGKHAVPPGDVGIVAIISANKAQALDRLKNVKAILLGMGMVEDCDFKATGETIEFIGRNIAFRVFAANRMAAVGFTCICLICDELALWRNEETGANPAKEILAWLRPTMATQRAAHIFLSSSPFSTLDAHHEAFKAGDTASQLVAYAPTWVANPTLTEAQTMADELDIIVWTRQYKAEPVSANAASFFDPAAIEAAIREYDMPPKPSPGTVVTAGCDPAFTSDSAAMVIAHRVGPWEACTVWCADILELRPEPNVPLKPSHVFGTFASKLKQHGCEVACSDGHYKMSAVEVWEPMGISFLDAPLTVAEPFIRLRSLLHEGRIVLPNHDKLIRQLKEVLGRPTPNGSISIIQPRKKGGGHGDIVSAFVLAVWQRNGYVVPDIALQFGTPEYWARVRSPDYIDEQERLNQEREADEMQAREDDPWWEQST